MIIIKAGSWSDTWNGTLLRPSQKLGWSPHVVAGAVLALGRFRINDPLGTYSKVYLSISEIRPTSPVLLSRIFNFYELWKHCRTFLGAPRSAVHEWRCPATNPHLSVLVSWQPFEVPPARLRADSGACARVCITPSVPNLEKMPWVVFERCCSRQTETHLFTAVMNLLGTCPWKFGTHGFYTIQGENLEWDLEWGSRNLDCQWESVEIRRW